MSPSAFSIVTKEGFDEFSDGRNFIFLGVKKQEALVMKGQMLGDLGGHEAVHSTLATSSPPSVNPLSKQLRKLQGKEGKKLMISSGWAVTIWVIKSMT